MPEPISLSAKPKPKPSIDLSAALRSTLRAWLAARDTAIWALVSGSNAQDGGPILDIIDWDQSLASVKRMNSLREIAYDFAAQINAHSAESVLRAELDGLLTDERPKFSLDVDGLPSAF